METGLERQVPHDGAAEQHVLGALLIDRDAIFKVADVLHAFDFYEARHQRIYATAEALLERRERIDPLTVQMELGRREELDRVGGAAYLRELAEAVPTALEIEAHARAVREKAILRRLFGAATGIAADAYDEPTDIALTLDRAEQRIFALRDESSNAQLHHIQQALLANYQALSERMEHPFEVSGLASGFREIDTYTEGFTPGDLVILAARPSVGKTSLALAMAHNVARRGEPVLVFSLEMDVKQIVARFLGLNSRVDLLSLRTGNELDSNAASSLMGLPIYIDDTPGLSVMEMRTKARRVAVRGKLGLVVVDYLQLMRTGEREENRVQEVSTISRNLKSLARELNTTVVALSQLSRAAGDSGGEPKLATLRECVTGDTLVQLANGLRTPIRDLVGRTPDVLAVDEAGLIIRAKSDLVWKVGRRPVFKVKLASGRSIRATAKHRLLGFGGWRRVADVKVGDRIAIARQIPEPEDPGEWPERRLALLGQLIGDGSERGITARDMSSFRGTAYSSPAQFAFSPSRNLIAQYAELLDDALLSAATSHLFWDSIAAVEPAGEEDVFDITVPDPSNWIADGVVTHNSGSLEQDSDIVIMLWREKEDTPPGAPRLIHGSIGKNRNGPTGRFELYFESQQARFFSRADDQGMPV